MKTERQLTRTTRRKIDSGRPSAGFLLICLCSHKPLVALRVLRVWWRVQLFERGWIPTPRGADADAWDEAGERFVAEVEEARSDPLEEGRRRAIEAVDRLCVESLRLTERRGKRDNLKIRC